MSRVILSEVAPAEETATLGFRLHAVEVYNWGTFHGRVWSFPVDGHNALLTGDIGSGKSTLVDAVTTLLLPAHRVSYNKAAGGTTRERDLRSYVRGYYRSERSEATGTTRPVALRPGAATYSVVLGVFKNAGYDTAVTLAQVFWTTTSQGQPERFFVVADEELSISGHFGEFGGEIGALKRRLRASGAQVHDNFPPYGKAYRRALGIDSEQAMELFHQTVSMKSVTDLNDFVRSHMLEPFDAAGWIDRLVNHFEDLSRAHDSVITARRQVDQLAPLLADAQRYEDAGASVAALTEEHDALGYFVARHRHHLFATDLDDVRGKIDDAERRAGKLAEEENRLTARRDVLIEERAGAGGDRIGEIVRQIETAGQERDRRRGTADIVAHLLTDAGLPAAASKEQFGAAIEAARSAAARLTDEQADAQREVTRVDIARTRAREESEELNAELLSLRSRRNNLPRENLEIRAAISADLGIDPDELPFAGELIQVRTEEAAWEPAAERLLRPFGISLLVPEDHYRDVSDWMDARHLGMRLVYFRVPRRVVARGVPSAGVGDLLHTKLQLRDDSPMYEWLEHELQHRAALVCATTMEAFRRADRAVTLSGQIKDRQRHEKNDRFRIDDRSRYVLGWTNQAKIDTLLNRAAGLHGVLQNLDADAGRLTAHQHDLQKRAATLATLEHYRSWDDIDWQATAVLITQLEAERRRLEASSGVLVRIAEELSTVEAAQRTSAAQRHLLGEELGGLREMAQNLLAGIRECEQTMDAGPAPDDPVAARLTSRSERTSPSTVAAWSTWERAARTAVNGERATAQSEQMTLVSKVERAMSRFRQDFPAQTVEMDASVTAAGEYRALSARLIEDDLPRFESEFKTYLNTNTIRDVAGFQAELNKQLSLIRKRIDTINDSLVGIDYNPGRYIRLEAQRTPSVEIREFQSELRACTEGALDADGRDEQYSETKFLQVKAIIERFRGRTGQTDADRAWTRRVTDVRNWYVFIASERRREDDGEHESYSDSGGKSGGQKEKLAYTILAASLAYQFKLDWDVERSRTFRFVVIDEAFGRGSDESTRFGLALFARLGLQLVIVTPLQKIPVIAPYVLRVGFAENRTGSNSQLQTLTIEEFRRQHGLHRRLAAAQLIELAE
jgi:uncharacterized protein YPO0396